MTLTEAIKIMTQKIVSILIGNKSTIYLYGSVTHDDFKLGWSDIDILVLTEREIDEQQANILVSLRQEMLKQYPENPYFRLFEGGLLSLDAFQNSRSERVVYWGTSGERITDKYEFNSLSMTELQGSGVLLHGDDISNNLTYPPYAQMRDDVRHHINVARKHGTSVGWLLDIARGIYTLRTGKVISKTAAGEWALNNGLCSDVEELQKAVAVRKEPNKYSKEEKNIDNAVIQQFADVIDTEFANTIERFAKSELERMDIAYTNISLIRDKDGVSVWRVTTEDNSFVMKCFDKAEYRREIANYKLLTELGVPTLKVISHTECSLLLEDIEHSIYRFATPEDIRNPIIAEKIASWHKTLHEKGMEYPNIHTLYDECDCFTLENLQIIKTKTGTGDLHVWVMIEAHFDKIKSVVTELPRTIAYNDFHFTNMVVAKDTTSVIVFDYNMLGKGYIYSDIRNVYWHLGNEDARNAFLSAYGGYDETEKVIDDVMNLLNGLHIACERSTFPNWGNELLDMVKDGRLLTAVEKFLEVKSL